MLVENTLKTIPNQDALDQAELLHALGVKHNNGILIDAAGLIKSLAAQVQKLTADIELMQSSFAEPFRQKSNFLAKMDGFGDRQSSWAEIGLFLIDVQDEQLWRETDATYVKWLDRFAKRLQICRASLWKYRAGVVIGLDFLKIDRAGARPQIVAQLARTEADLLDIVKKLAEVSTESVASGLVDGVFSGTVGRKALRQMWLDYKQQGIVPYLPLNKI